ncbi:MAG: carbonic anhydrase [Planctomycetota bacterium]
MAITDLLSGWARFRSGRFQTQGDLFRRLHDEGQRPRVAMVACCDSRVDPSMVFDCDPGDLFVVRNVANLVPPCEEIGSYHGTSAALEFAVTVLQVKHIVVLGHALCGGIRALLTGPPPDAPPMRFLSAWIGLAQEARTVALAASRLEEPARQAMCERLAIRLSVRNLTTFPEIAARVDAGQLHLHGWHFDGREAQLQVLDHATGRFVPAAEDVGAGDPPAAGR